MNEVLPTVLIALGSALATGFGSWVFFIRKHKAEAEGTEKTNDRTEIENQKIITQEWREAAQQWKLMADEYLERLIVNSRKVAELEDEMASLKRQLDRAQRRISHLERDQLNHKTTDGNQ